MEVTDVVMMIIVGEVTTSKMLGREWCQREVTTSQMSGEVSEGRYH